MGFVGTFWIGRRRVSLYEGPRGCELREIKRKPIAFPNRSAAVGYIERSRAARFGGL